MTRWGRRSVPASVTNVPGRWNSRALVKNGLAVNASLRRMLVNNGHVSKALLLARSGSQPLFRQSISSKMVEAVQ